MLVLKLVRGTSRSFPLQANNSDGTPAIGLFVDTDAISSRVWPGIEQTTLMQPTTTWIDAPLGTFQVEFSDSDTTGLDFGQYRIQSTASRGGGTVLILDAFVSVAVTPGVVAPRPVYGPYSDMIKFAPWLVNLQTEVDLEGFADHRADARDWLNNIIARNYRGVAVGGFEYHSQAALEWGWGGQRRSLVPSRFIQDLLEAKGSYAGLTTGGVLSSGTYADQELTPPNVGALLLKPPILRVVAFRAIAEVCMQQLGKGGDYASYGAAFRQAADAECCNLTAELDINRDGWCEIPIPITSASTLYT